MKLSETTRTEHINLLISVVDEYIDKFNPKDTVLLLGDFNVNSLPWNSVNEENKTDSNEKGKMNNANVKMLSKITLEC